MSQARIYSFSVKKQETEKSRLCESVKHYSIQTGISFSHICVEALKLYKELVINNPELREPRHGK